MVAGNVYQAYGPGKDSNQLQELLRSMSLNEDQAGNLGDGGTARRLRTREVASRYKAATISSSQAVATTAQRYQSPSRGRSPSPNLARNTPLPETSAPKTRASSADRRPISVERRRPWPSSAAENKAPNTAINHSGPLSYKKSQGRGLDSLWPSTNSLSSSLRSEVSNVSSNSSGENELESDQTLKPTPNGANKNSFSAKALRQGKLSERKETSERRTTFRAQDRAEQGENSKPLENVASAIQHHRWPGASSAKALMSKSMDLSSSSLRRAASLLVPSRYRSAPKVEKPIAPNKTLSRSVSVGANRNVVRRIYSDSRDLESITRASKLDYGREFEEKTSTWENVGAPRESLEEATIGSLTNGISYDEIGSDTETSSSSALSVASVDSSRGAGKGTIVPARFWQDTTNRFGQNTGAFVSESVDGGKQASRRSKAASSIANGASATSNSNRSITPTRSMSGPLTSLQSPLSPSSQARSVQSTSPSRGWASPTFTRPLQAMCSSLLPLNGRHALNPSLEMRKSRKGVSQQEEAYDLRLLHNRWLQWRFVNAHAEMALDTQTAMAESLLHDVALGICDLQLSVATKQAKRNKIMQTLKLNSVLDSYSAHLVQWESVQSEHSTALTAVMKALESAVIRVPVTGGPKVDVQVLKEVLSSGMDIVNTVGPSVGKCLRQAEVADALLSELAKTMVLEKASLQECGDLLAAFSALETEERSLRMYLIQTEQDKLRSIGNRINLTNSLLVR